MAEAPKERIWVKMPGIPHGEHVLFDEAYDVDLWDAEGWKGDVNPSQQYVNADIADRHKRERDKLRKAAKGYVEWQAGEDASFEAEAKAEGALRAAIAECGED